jgi:hypothetical protein
LGEWQNPDPKTLTGSQTADQISLMASGLKWSDRFSLGENEQMIAWTGSARHLTMETSAPAGDRPRQRTERRVAAPALLIGSSVP